MRIKGITLSVSILLAFIGLFAGITISQHLQVKKKIDMTQFHGTYMENPRPINKFTLMGTDHKLFDSASLLGHWTLVFFGFTQCGYLCPTTMAELAKMYRLLEEQGVNNLPQVVMISLDPKRDNLEKLAHYVNTFHPSFYGARGDSSLIKAMTREMGIAFMRVNHGADSKNYDVQHSGAVILFNPKGELAAFFTTPHHADLLAEDYLLLIS